MASVSIVRSDHALVLNRTCDVVDTPLGDLLKVAEVFAPKAHAGKHVFDLVLGFGDIEDREQVPFASRHLNAREDGEITAFRCPKPPDKPSHGRGHWFDPSSAH